MARRADPTAHEALLEASRTQFASRGLERAKIEDIARRAGVSKGAFYLHFRSKEDAFREILQRFLGALEEHARERHESECRFVDALAASGGPTLEQALEFECAADTGLLELLWRNRQILAALDGASGQQYAHVVGHFRHRMRALVADRVLGMQAEGRLRRGVRADVVGDVIIGTYEGFGRRMAKLRQKPDLAAWARSLLVIVYQGILDPEAGRRATARRGKEAG